MAVAAMSVAVEEMTVALMPVAVAVMAVAVMTHSQYFTAHARAPCAPCHTPHPREAPRRGRGRPRGMVELHRL